MAHIALSLLYFLFRYSDHFPLYYSVYWFSDQFGCWARVIYKIDEWNGFHSGSRRQAYWLNNYIASFSAYTSFSILVSTSVLVPLHPNEVPHSPILCFALVEYLGRGCMSLKQQSTEGRVYGVSVFWSYVIIASSVFYMCHSTLLLYTSVFNVMYILNVSSSL